VIRRNFPVIIFLPLHLHLCCSFQGRNSGFFQIFNRNQPRKYSFRFVSIPGCQHPESFHFQLDPVDRCLSRTFTTATGCSSFSKIRRRITLALGWMCMTTFVRQLRHPPTCFICNSTGEESQSCRLVEGGGAWRLEVQLGRIVRQLGMWVHYGVHVLAVCEEETRGEAN
jgi:hypothetical protein